MKELVTKEVAVKEVESWLDYRRVKASQRETYKAQIGTLVEGVQFGDITIDAEKHTITQAMQFPEATKSLFTSLTYQPRISIGDLQKHTTNVKATDFEGKVVAYMAALTGQGMSGISKMDSEDYKIGQAIALFFM